MSAGEARQASGALFPLGRVVSTPGALAALREARTAPADLLYRHVTGDWGDLDSFDRAENTRALEIGARILSSYILSTGSKLWLITESDRSSTCLLLPEEY